MKLYWDDSTIPSSDKIIDSSYCVIDPNDFMEGTSEDSLEVD